MTKKELIRKINKESGIRQKEIERVFSSYANITMDSLRKGDTVPIISLGKFDVKHRKARQQNNPKTNKKMIVEAKNLPTFRMSKQFRNCIY